MNSYVLLGKERARIHGRLQRQRSDNRWSLTFASRGSLRFVSDGLHFTYGPSTVVLDLPVTSMYCALPSLWIRLFALLHVLLASSPRSIRLGIRHPGLGLMCLTLRS